MFANTITALNARLDSGDEKVVYAAAIDAFVKAEDSAEKTHLLAKAVVRVDASPTSRRQWIADLLAKGVIVKPATASNLANAWDLGVKVSDGSEPTPLFIKHAKRIFDNVKVADRDRWLTTMPESAEDRPAWLAHGFANYQTIGTVTVEPVPSLNTDEPVKDEPVKPVVETIDGKLSVLSGIAAQIAAGAFTVEEAYQLAKAAVAIVNAGEAFASAAAAVETVAA